MTQTDKDKLTETIRDVAGVKMMALTELLIGQLDLPMNLRNVKIVFFSLESLLELLAEQNKIILIQKDRS